jgi:hypothetical protein
MTSMISALFYTLLSLKTVITHNLFSLWHIDQEVPDLRQFLSFFHQKIEISSDFGPRRSTLFSLYFLHKRNQGGGS